MRAHSAAMRKRHAEILELVDRCYRLSDAIARELAQRFGLETPARN